MAATDYGTVQPLCDVRGCHEPQTGEILELEVEGEFPPLWVRVRPCLGHRDRLVRHLKRSNEV